MIGAGFAYDAVRAIARATQERRADRDYWREIRARRRDYWRDDRPGADGSSIEASIAAQLDHDVFLASPRHCPECRQMFMLVRMAETA